MESQTIELGDEVRDTVTSFSGVVIAVTEWLNGCRRMTIQPRELKEKGSLPSCESFDETQLVVVTKHAVVAPNTPKLGGEPTPARKTGGPRPEPQQYPWSKTVG